jgi:hypothetical protein
MIAMRWIASTMSWALVLVMAAIPAGGQTNLEIPQTRSQGGVGFSAAPQGSPSPSRGNEEDSSTLQIAPQPTPAAPQQAAPSAQYPDPAVAAAAAAAAAAVNALLMMQHSGVPTPAAPAAPSPAPPVSSLAIHSQPALPAVFRGCWQGEVATVDHLERLPGAHKLGYWTPKTYKLCYRRVGNGPFELTLTEAGVVPNEQITNARGHVDALETDGRAYAKMRSDLHFDEYQVGAKRRGETFAVDEVTMLDCRIDGNGMVVSASVYGTRDGEPWFRARWRANFRPVPE